MPRWTGSYVFCRNADVSSLEFAESTDVVLRQNALRLLDWTFQLANVCPIRLAL